MQMQEVGIKEKNAEEIQGTIKPMMFNSFISSIAAIGVATSL